MSIVLVGSTSGSITLQEPAVAGTTVLTLPAVSGTILTTASSGQSIPKAALPTGSVLQVVNATYSTQSSMSSSTYADSGLTVSITPTSSSSKILVAAHLTGIYVNDSANYLRAKVLRNSTDITNDFSNVAGGYNASNGNIGAGTVSISYLDSPATTSTTTYKVQVSSATNSQTVYWSNGGSYSSITLLEIAA